MTIKFLDKLLSDIFQFNYLIGSFIVMRVIQCFLFIKEEAFPNYKLCENTMIHNETFHIVLLNRASKRFSTSHFLTDQVMFKLFENNTHTLDRIKCYII